MNKKNVIIFGSFLFFFSITYITWKGGYDYFVFQELYGEEKYQEILDSNYRGNKYIEGLHNLGNTYYRFSQKDEEKKQKYLEQALEYFSGSLLKEENEDTRFNYEFVKKLLEEGQQEDQQQDQQQDQQKTGSGSIEGDSQDMTESGDTGTGETTQSGGVGEQEEDQKSTEISEDEKQLLEQTLQDLQKQQLYNQQYFNKQPQEQGDSFQNLFDSFFGNINRGGEKDW